MMRGREVGCGLRAFAATTYALGIVAMVLSLSRGNWIAFVAAHAVFLMLVNRKLLVGAVAVAAVLVALGAPLLPGIVRDRIQETTTTGQNVYQVPLAVGLEGSTAARVVFAKIGLDMFVVSPVWGHGLNGVPPAHAGVRREVRTPQALRPAHPVGPDRLRARH